MGTRYYPAFDEFCRLSQGADLVPVRRRLLSDSLTPVTAFHKLDAGRCAFLAESVVGGEKVGRYSFLATHPFMEIEAYENRVTVSAYTGISASGQPLLESRQFESDNPLDELRKQIESRKVASVPGFPPFCGGAVGYAGYDVVRYCEHLPNPPADDRNVPDLSFAFYDQMVVFDHINKTIDVIVLADTSRPGISVKQSYDRACRRIDEIVDLLSETPCSLKPLDIDTEGDPQIEYTSNFTQERFEEAVRKCVEYIRAGDIFQVVISQRLAVPLRSHPFDIYRVLRVVNPSPFMFYQRSPSVTLVGSSPEIMVRVVDGHVTTRPLAGTRRRGASEEEDQRLAEELLADPKERAEHVMLVDLGRNDIGRVSRFRSVELTDVMTIERYSHVMHITSNVNGVLAPGKTAFDALQACLPAGTVSGAPKVRAMEIIDELEPHRRGPYAGAVGYFDFNGNMDTCIALRTIVIQGDTAYVQAGAGIVADSQPTNEWNETLNKARGLLKALEIAGQKTHDLARTT
ncbi:anthranilate synthase component I [Thermostilla marina]